MYIVVEINAAPSDANFREFAVRYTVKSTLLSSWQNYLKLTHVENSSSSIQCIHVFTGIELYYSARNGR